jgi:hypothetical protein
MSSQAILSFVLLAGILACVKIGQRLGGPHVAKGTDVVDGAMFGLLSLLVAFTFSGAATRFDGRRHLMGEEANAIGTAYLRLDLVAPEARGPLKEHFRQYTDARIALYQSLHDSSLSTTVIDHSGPLEATIWTEAVDATRGSPGTIPQLVLSPINVMIDMTTTQRVATETHPPGVIYGMLAGLALVTGLLLGRRMAGEGSGYSFHIVLYVCVLAGVVYVIQDLEYPRRGFIRVDSADHVLIDLRASMK